MERRKRYGLGLWLFSLYIKVHFFGLERTTHFPCATNQSKLYMLTMEWTQFVYTFVFIFSYIYSSTHINSTTIILKQKKKKKFYKYLFQLIWNRSFDINYIYTLCICYSDHIITFILHIRIKFYNIDHNARMVVKLKTCLSSRFNSVV